MSTDAHQGKPLHNWGDDKKAGDVEEDGRMNVWRIAAPRGQETALREFELSM